MARTSIDTMNSITGERFAEMLNILPPLNWHGIGDSAESFRVSEMLDCNTVTIFVRLGSPWPAPKYFELVAGDGVTHQMAVSHCAALLQPATVPA
jgi:hypothetical protein